MSEIKIDEIKTEVKTTSIGPLPSTTRDRLKIFKKLRTYDQIFNDMMDALQEDKRFK